MIVICGKCRQHNEIEDQDEFDSSICTRCSARLKVGRTDQKHLLQDNLTSKPIWFVKIGTKVSGPISWKSMEMLVDSGKLSLEDEIWSVDEPKPKKLAELNLVREKIEEHFKTHEYSTSMPAVNKTSKRIDWIDWWYLDESGTHGPVSVEQLKLLIKSRRISRDAHVRFSGLNRWIPLKTGVDVIRGRIKAESLIQQKSSSLNLDEITANGLFFRNPEKTRGPLCLEDFIHILETEEFELDDEVWMDNESGWVTLEAFLPTIDPNHSIHRIVKEREKEDLMTEEEKSEEIESECPHCYSIRTVRKEELHSWRLCSYCHEPYRVKEYRAPKVRNRYMSTGSEVIGIMTFPFKVFDLLSYYVEGLGRHGMDFFIRNGILFILAGLYCFFHFWFSDPTKMDSPDRVFEEIEILGAGFVLIFVGMVLWATPKS